MKEHFRFIKLDKILARIFLASGLVIALTIIYILFKYSDLPPSIPLFNQLPWGNRRLSETIGIFIPLIIVFLIFIINILLSALIYKKTPLVSRLLAATSLLTSVLNLLFIIRTIQIVL